MGNCIEAAIEWTSHKPLVDMQRVNSLQGVAGWLAHQWLWHTAAGLCSPALRGNAQRQNLLKVAFYPEFILTCQPGFLPMWMTAWWAHAPCWCRPLHTERWASGPWQPFHLYRKRVCVERRNTTTVPLCSCSIILFTLRLLNYAHIYLSTDLHLLLKVRTVCYVVSLCVCVNGSRRSCKHVDKSAEYNQFNVNSIHYSGPSFPSVIGPVGCWNKKLLLIQPEWIY